MKIFSSLLLLTALSVLNWNCQKETTTPDPAKTNTEHITASPWTHEDSGIDTDKNGTIDIQLSLFGITLPACRLDNMLTFKTGGTATADEGPTKCNTADPQSTNFNWSFADAEKSLVISGNVFTELNGKFAIRELTATNLTLSKDTTLPAPFNNAAIVVKLKH